MVSFYLRFKEFSLVLIHIFIGMLLVLGSLEFAFTYGYSWRVVSVTSALCALLFSFISVAWGKK